MRDPDRIKPFMEMFTDYWERNPDLRFGQIVANMYMIAQDSHGQIFGIDPYYIEDDESMDLLIKQKKGMR